MSLPCAAPPAPHPWWLFLCSDIRYTFYGWLPEAPLGLFFRDILCSYSFAPKYFANLTDFLLGPWVPSLFKAFTQTALSPCSNSVHSAGRLRGISTEQFVPSQRPSLLFPCFVILPCLFVGCLPTPPDSELPEGEGLLALSSNMLSEPGLAPSTKSS